MTPKKFRIILHSLVIGSLLSSSLFHTDAQRISRKRFVRKELDDFRRLPAKLSRMEDLMKGVRGIFPSPLSAPLTFQSNVGQSDPRFPFIVRGVNFAAGFTPTGITASVVRHQADEDSVQGVPLKGNAITLSFKGASPAALTGLQAVKGSINSIVGKDRTRWLKGVPSFNALQYTELYPGIQAFVSGRSGRLEYAIVLDAGADIRNIRIAVDGVQRLRLDARGNLIMETSGGPILQTQPQFVEHKWGAPRKLKGRFVILGKNEYGFEVSGHIPRTRLVIDPDVVFSTYFGGEGQEGFLGTDLGANDFIGRGFDIAFGSDGSIFVIGMTASTDFPVTSGGAMQGSADVFVMRLDPAQPAGQQLIYATFIGGSDTERGRAIAPLEDGSAYITGHSNSSDFPTSSGVVQAVRERSGAYVARLMPDGTFDIGTMIGRTLSHHPNSVVFSKSTIEAEGFVYVAGSARPRFGRPGDATSDSFQSSHAGGEFDGFVAKLDKDLTGFEYFTYLGGANRDVIMDLDVNDGFAFVTGSTTSFNFPTTPLARQSQHSEQSNAGVDCSATDPPRQCFDAFVTRVDRTGIDLIYSTYLGSGREEYARGIAVADNNQATITGGTRAADGTESQIFVLRFEAGGENVLWDQRLAGGANQTDHGEEVVVDQLGRAHVIGTVSRDGLSMGGNAETFLGGSSDIFYARFTNDGANNFFTYLGGTGTDRGFAVAAAGANEDNFCATVVGSTTSDDISTLSPLLGGATRRGRADLILFTLCDREVTINDGDCTHSASPVTVLVGEMVTFTITLTNGGDIPVPVTLIDNVPNSFEVTGVLGPNCTRSGDNGNDVRCSFNAEPGATAIEIRARAGQQCPIRVENSATILVPFGQFTKSASVQINCIPPLCPNGRIDPGEQCDDGNFNGGDGCRRDCTRERCTDGIQDPGEQCDDGNLNDNDRCTNACRIRPACGEVCTIGGRACVTGCTCTRSCSPVTTCLVKIGDLCIGEDTFLMCQVDATCQ
jgi:cysteine-rich repeat protein